MLFALFMLIALAITGAVWLLDIAYLRKVRPEGKAESWVVEYSKSFFPVILAVFMIRSFLVEPELRRMSIEIFNDAMAELQAESNNRLFPMALMPWEPRVRSRWLTRKRRMISPKPRVTMAR